METTAIRTREKSIQRTEEILSKITDLFHVVWEFKPKGYQFELIGYQVIGEIFIVQLFDDGSIYHFMGTDSIRWDLTEKSILEHFANKSGSAIKTQSSKQQIQSLHKGESNDLMDKGWNEAIEHITKNVL